MSTMALAFEPDFQSFLHDLHRGPADTGGRPGASASARNERDVVSVAVAPTAAATYRRRRISVLAAVVSGLVAVSSLLGATGVFGAVVAPAAASGESIAESGSAGLTHVVQPGDTLWSIVGGLDLDGDHRAAVHAVAKANGGATLSPGQVVVLDAALGS